MNADQMSLESILRHAVKVGLAVEIPWCAEHDAPIVNPLDVGTEDGQCWQGFIESDEGVGFHCRLEEPATVFRIVSD